ncbi:hypothetical protein JVT61DRAFT_4773 [Boletus reticuloceps]|uniref:Serine-threonine/tyrosine-protein kinase catalytic domain-containing protein n=1 Tax=Boletus reticuloceps TaxID=495285 RepID=A0A8I2YMZ2_9AGAM|nr:hypothetical protein JVT61DRAFT_4773 [Boletus reticuloceps]
MFERESRIWKKLNHRNILPLIGLTCEFGPIPSIITPWMSEGTLTGFVHRNHNQFTAERRLTIVGSLPQQLDDIDPLITASRGG